MTHLLGWTGAVLILGAYALVSLGKLPPSSRLWAGMNIVGSGALAWSSLLDRRWPFVTLNLVWAGVGIWSLINPPRPAAEPVTPDHLDPPQPTAR